MTFSWVLENAIQVLYQNSFPLGYGELTGELKYQISQWSHTVQGQLWWSKYWAGQKNGTRSCDVPHDILRHKLSTNTTGVPTYYVRQELQVRYLKRLRKATAKFVENYDSLMTSLSRFCYLTEIHHRLCIVLAKSLTTFSTHLHTNRSGNLYLRKLCYFSVFIIFNTVWTLLPWY